MTAEVVLDVQTNSLLTPISMSQPSMQWEITQWPQWTTSDWQTGVCVQVHELRKSNDPPFSQDWCGFGIPSQQRVFIFHSHFKFP